VVAVDETLTPKQADRLLQEWLRMAHELSKIKSQEFLLRSRVFKHFFPHPDEGTNTFELGAGYKLKAAYPFTREVDEGSLKSKDNEFKAAGIDPSLLVKYKPALVTAIYRTLTLEQQRLFDTILTIKPGAPSLKIDAPKGKGKDKSQPLEDDDADAE
jgi:hypothetical protein